MKNVSNDYQKLEKKTGSTDRSLGMSRRHTRKTFRSFSKEIDQCLDSHSGLKMHTEHLLRYNQSHVIVNAEQECRVFALSSEYLM